MRYKRRMNTDSELVLHKFIERRNVEAKVPREFARLSAKQAPSFLQFVISCAIYVVLGLW